MRYDFKYMLFYGNEDDVIHCDNPNVKSPRGRLSLSILRQLLIAVLMENEITSAGR